MRFSPILSPSSSSLLIKSSSHRRSDVDMRASGTDSCDRSLPTLSRVAPVAAAVAGGRVGVSDNEKDDDDDDDADAIELSRVSASDGGEAAVDDDDDDKEEFELLRLRLLGSGSGDDDDDRFRDFSSYCRAACIDVRGWSMVSMIGIVDRYCGPLPASPPATVK